MMIACGCTAAVEKQDGEEPVQGDAPTSTAMAFKTNVGAAGGSGTARRPEGGGGVRLPLAGT